MHNIIIILLQTTVNQADRGLGRCQSFGKTRWRFTIEVSWFRALFLSQRGEVNDFHIILKWIIIVILTRETISIPLLSFIIGIWHHPWLSSLIYCYEYISKLTQHCPKVFTKSSVIFAKLTADMQWRRKSKHTKLVSWGSIILICNGNSENWLHVPRFSAVSKDLVSNYKHLDLKTEAGHVRLYHMFHTYDCLITAVTHRQVEKWVDFLLRSFVMREETLYTYFTLYRIFTQLHTNCNCQSRRNSFKQWVESCGIDF